MCPVTDPPDRGENASGGKGGAPSLRGQRGEGLGADLWGWMDISGGHGSVQTAGAGTRQQRPESKTYTYSTSKHKAVHILTILFLRISADNSNGFSSVQETWYWDGGNVTEMVLSGVKCKGDEMTLTDCQHHSAVSCKRAGAEFSAGVICSDSKSHHTESFSILSNDLKTQCGLISNNP